MKFVLAIDQRVGGQYYGSYNRTLANIPNNIYGDGYELFFSKLMDVNSVPQEFKIPVKGIRQLQLVARTQDWLPYFAQCGNWIQMKLERE